MSDLINLQIDGKSIQAKEGESILNVARANDIFVPAICYLTRCSPTLACRLCLVEADGKQVYACNAKVKEDMSVTVNTTSIVKERRAIMEVYDVNHPLQCGVCDQSGECELQNYSLYMKVDQQNYAIPDVPRPTQHWGVMNYDPGLCIVCEKCVTVCKDMVGSSALSTVKRGSEAISKTFKDEMPKDAYAMWNKLNKSLIGFNEDACTDCGECISVCPVGALVSHDFQYKSNSWELNKIPASNPHSSDCSLMYYETKHESVLKHDVQKVYRVTNDHHYVTLNGAARFAYDFENKVQEKDEKAFNEAVNALKKANTIKFSSFITNEEAFILQKLKEKLGVKLINSDAYSYAQFLKNFSRTSGESLYNASLEDVHKSNFVISLGSFLKHDLPHARYALNNSVVTNKGAALYFHPILDPIMEQIGKKGKSTEFIAYKPLSEEAVLYFILDTFAKDLPPSLASYLDSLKETRVKTIKESIKETIIEHIKDEETQEEKEVKKVVSKEVSKEVEYTYYTLLENIGAQQDLAEIIIKMLVKKDSYSLIIGEDLISHENSKNIAKLCGLIQKYTEFKLVIIPTKTNTLGVSLLCDLDEEEEGFVFSYNVKGDYEISALGDGSLDMPALNQQEGTFVSIDKKLVPTNAALPYKGYTLNELANEILDVQFEHTIEYTSMFPLEKGFKNIDFDDLKNTYSNDQKNNRGYIISSYACESFDEYVEYKKDEILLEEGEILIYRANPMNQFNEFTAICHEFAPTLQSGIFVSQELMEKLELEQNDRVSVVTNNIALELSIYLDKQIKGEIAYVSTFEKDLNTKELFDTYRYTQAVVKKV